MKTVALALTLFATSQASESWKQAFTQADLDTVDIKTIWDDWKSSFGRGYATLQHDAHRFSIFMSNLDGIVAHNSQDSSYKMQLNQGYFNGSDKSLVLFFLCYFIFFALIIIFC